MITFLVCSGLCHGGYQHSIKTEMQTNAGASLEDVSLLLAHHIIKITERHYLSSISDARTG
jgi:hypothetical protein